MTLRTYISLFLACSMLALVAGGYAVSRYVNAHKADIRWQRGAASLLDSVDELVGLGLKDAGAVANALANLPEVRDAATSLPRAGDTDAALTPAALLLGKRLKETLPLLPQMTSLFVSSADGGFMLHSSGEESQGSSASSAPASPVAELATTHGTAVSEAYIVPSAGAVAVLVSAPVPGTNAVAGVSLSLGPLVDAVLDLRLGVSGRVLLVDGQGRILVSPLDPAATLLPARDALSRAVAVSSGPFSAILDGVEYMGFARAVRDTRWKAAVFAPRTETASAAARDSVATAAVTACLAVLVFIGGVLATFRITRPFTRFRKEVDAVLAGDFTTLGQTYASTPELVPVLAGMHKLATHAQRLAAEHAGKMEEAARREAMARELCAKAEEAARQSGAVAAQARTDAARAVAALRAQAGEALARTRDEAQTRMRESVSRAHAELQSAAAQTEAMADHFASLAAGFDGIADTIADAAEAHTAAVTARNEESIRTLSAALHAAHTALKAASAHAGAAQMETAEALRAAGESVFILRDMRRNFAQASELLGSRKEKMRGTERTAKSLHEALRGMEELGSTLNLLAFDASIKASSRPEGDPEFAAFATELRQLASGVLTVSSSMNASVSEVARSIASAITGLGLTQGLLERSSDLPEEAASRLETTLAQAEAALAEATLRADAAHVPLPLVDIDALRFIPPGAAPETAWGKTLREALDRVAEAAANARTLAERLRNSAERIKR